MNQIPITPVSENNRTRRPSFSHFHIERELTSPAVGPGKRKTSRRLSVLNVAELPKETPTLSVSACALSCANAAVNIGALAFPFGFKLCGAGLGASIVVLIAAIMLFSLFCLCRAMDNTKQNHLQGITGEFFGQRAAQVMFVLLTMSQFGCCVVYLLVTTAQIESLVASLLPSLQAFLPRQAIVLAVSAGIALPISLIRDISILSKAHYVSLVCMLLVEGITVWTSTRVLQVEGIAEGVEMKTQHAGILQGAAIFCFAMSAHTSFVPFVRSLSEPTPGRRRVSAIGCVTSILALVLPMGLFGYLQYGSLTQGDVVADNMPPSGLGLLSRGLVALTAISTFGPVVYVCRLGIGDLVLPKGATLTDPEHSRTFTWLTFALVAIAAWIAASISSAKTVMGLIGGTIVSVQAFVLPGMFLVSSRSSGVLGILETICGIGLVFFGVGFGIVSTWATLFLHFD